jgi:hypothetical protein
VQNDAQPHASSVDTDTSEPKAECSTAPHNKKLKLLEDMERDFDEPPADANRNVNHELVQEIVSYLGPVRLSTEKLCPLLFWKRNEYIYKRISTLARVYLTSNASSMPVESLFSITGLIKNARRSPIALFLLNKLTFVHDNYGKFFPLKK